ncbi:MAG: DUF1579 domain-containing protein [Fimbriimonadaceae bacterium]|nr:DUF1579 family protein [Chthonomonadaceae bacterium]MCO5296619.1 DUF1579 domain-containing protein [Fimbriimonadaceae bacterium]
MSVPEFWKAMIGSWTGENKLWLMPGDPSSDSKATARVEPLANGKFLGVHYTWEESGETQEGFALVGASKDGTSAQATWVDSWHMGDSPMALREVPSAPGVVALLGSYPAPEGPDWGWRVEFEPGGQDHWTMRMFNITPDGQEAPAVLAEFVRAPS